MANSNGKEKLMAMRAALRKDDERGSSGDNASYAFWNLSDDPKKGNTAVIRFLPDRDDSNEFFWRTREVINIPFKGTEGGDEGKAVEVQVPCMDMWESKKDFILNHTKSWWKTPKEEIARKYWKKRSYIFQGFVVESAIKEENPPENPIRRFLINPSIFKIIKGSLMDPEMENLPTDYEHGCDLRLIKTTKSTPQGMQADYTTSSWSRRERALRESELNAIDQYGLFDLKEFLPKRPSAEQLKAIEEMFLASLNEELYDPARWGQYFRPFGSGAVSTDTSNVDATLSATKKKAVSDDDYDEDGPSLAKAAVSRLKATDDDDDDDDDADTKPKSKAEMSDILALVNNRQTKK